MIEGTLLCETLFFLLDCAFSRAQRNELRINSKACKCLAQGPETGQTALNYSVVGYLIRY